MSDPLSDPHMPPSTMPPLLVVGADVATPPPTSDPPPPYPSRERRSTRTPRSNRRQARLLLQTQGQHNYANTHGHGQGSSADSDADGQIQRQSSLSPPPHSFPGSDSEVVNENTPLLAPPSPRSLRSPTRRTRPRSLSHTSILSYASAAPSLAQTVISLFQPEVDDDTDIDYDILNDPGLRRISSIDGQTQAQCDREQEQRRKWAVFTRRAWRRYFRPVTRKVYYMALFHLLVLNFPYALAAWIYLFVFTLTGTTLMIALPLGTVLCFFDLLGARAFARGELALQSTFHRPLAYPAPYPPRPIFTRLRQPTPSEIEAGHHTTTYETSFYKNAYSMFTDSTSYQALFYFLVIKPSITLILSISLVVLFPICFIFILPAPAFLRAMRKLGIWQANIAIEGLYLAVS